ncbi:DUF4174 domain-containing protein [Vibrio fluvialis]|nr:DUF4174 domain-containing protein [Vibrio fluvialis]
MRRILLALCLSCLPLIASAYPLYAHSWSHRSVLYFAPTQDEYVRQFLLETLMHECELDKRDVVTIIITEDGYSYPAWLKDEFDLRDVLMAYGVPAGSHTAVLVGKDGEEKLRWGKTTDWIKVKDTIDAMPMRQHEMQRQISRCQI